jgi:hypothetical protein
MLCFLFACLALSLAAGCGAKSTLDAAAGTGGGGTSGSGNGGTGTGGSAACNTLSDDSPTISPICPGGGVCPDCPDQTMGLGGSIADGTYFMTNLTVWGSGCGILAGAPAHATLSIHGPTMNLLSTGPAGLDPTQTVTTRASFSIFWTPMGNGLLLHQLCPTTTFGPQTIAYTVQGDQLILGGLDGIDGTPTFTRQ